MILYIRFIVISFTTIFNILFLPVQNKQLLIRKQFSSALTKYKKGDKNLKQKGRFMTMKKALITGITGQDGSYLAELLLEKGYEVHGIIRRASVSTISRIEHIIDKLFIHEGDLSDSSSIMKIGRQQIPNRLRRQHLTQEVVQTK